MDAVRLRYLLGCLQGLTHLEDRVRPERAVSLPAMIDQDLRPRSCGGQIGVVEHIAEPAFEPLSKAVRPRGSSLDVRRARGALGLKHLQ